MRAVRVFDTVDWQVAEEVPVAIVVNGVSHAVMMATPADLEDFAVGFCLTEDIIAEAAAVEAVSVSEHPKGLVAALTVPPTAVLRADPVLRGLAGRTGCGLCGVESLDDAVRPPRPVRRLDIDAEAVGRAFAALPDHQPLNRANRTMHAAAFCDADGAVRLAREDVGRHNALDKLVGAMAAAGLEGADGFMVMTSRCSFELVQKAARAGTPLLATLSAPTALALDLARQAGMTLATRGPGESIVSF
ncbi:Formate dehydrogenase chain D [Caenispirillum salinarum AK4]|uniref:Sulfur carrier protein FdhD n=1 Tax=Caenispirillum salinarum AK4 TaxID=1238182 RepID=K9H354_9PROT|nr:Formate dehydrogenase chain D [Caenispirillum salinarum AK4]